MIRSLTAIGIALALVGSAHAQDKVTVSIAGKSHAAVRADLYRAAEAVCTSDDGLDLRDDACVEATYSVAIQQLHAARPAPIQRAAYATQPAASGF
jgi:hypothetical protein